MENNTTNINKDQKYLDYIGLSHFFSSLDGAWWNRKFDIIKGQISSDISNTLSTELEKYLPLSAGENKNLTGSLYIGTSDSDPADVYIYGDIIPQTSGIYNLGKPESNQGSGDGKTWANIYSDNIITGNLTVTGDASVSGTLTVDKIVLTNKEGLDADTLDGHDSSYFAVKADVDKAIEDLEKHIADYKQAIINGDEDLLKALLAEGTACKEVADKIARRKDD